MKLYYYQGTLPNFGDDLNAWMWPRLMQNVWNEEDNKLFLGIGSIIYDFFPQEQQKIVFGAGYGGYTSLPVVDNNWKFYFVRGKLTAKALNLDPTLAIGDAAILLRSCIKERPSVRRYKISFMPHWESTLDGAWAEACNAASIHYIDPCGTVENILDEILHSELIVTEAMHGAIVSDALRVPWIAVKPIQSKHHMKWYDWASALNITLAPSRISGSSFLEFVTHMLGEQKELINKVRRRSHLFKKVAPQFFIESAARKLLEISREHPNMSSDHAIAGAHDAMLEKMEVLLKDLKPQ